ncbi:unnamed protein product [Blepharisma stoltei]|uniref:Galactose oxidase n=1 Tax=Blepharisma stoltei TaxID=1481888 RepID=A0AAU9J2R8_9CILI|nr:unnamed protein product [Blepharisma stoltei]
MMILHFLLLFPTISASLNFTRLPYTNPPPPARCYNAMDYDPVTNSLIIFGGIKSNTELYRDIWQFELNTKLWNMLETTSSYYLGMF